MAGIDSDGEVVRDHTGNSRWQKKIGDALLHPRLVEIFSRTLPLLFLGFLLRCHSFLLSLDSEFAPAKLAERVISLMYSD